MSQPSEVPLSSPAPTGSPPEYSFEERQLLLQIARESIVSLLEGRELPLFTPSLHLSEPRGVFTTLHSNGHLRGCVGYPAALVPLYRATMETARAAAIDDPRFAPLALAEVFEIEISLSVLSPLVPVTAEEVQVGLHGMMISDGRCRGLLLPQVPTEQGWDRVTFLEQTCRKAGLPPDAWQRGAKIEAFTAEVFTDRE